MLDSHVMFDIRTPEGHAPGATPQEIFSAELKRTRERKGWTQQALSDRMTHLGSPVGRAAIAKIETGVRGVSIDEVVAFSVALGVSPSALVLGRDTRLIRVAPNLAVDLHAALSWWRGLYPLAPFQGRLIRDDEGNLDIEETDDERFFYDAIPDFEAQAERRLPSVLSIMRLAEGLVVQTVYGKSLKSVSQSMSAILETLQTLRIYVEHEEQIKRGKKILERKKALTAAKSPEPKQRRKRASASKARR